MRNERYYYGIMSPEEKKAYKMMYEGLKAKALNIEVAADISPDLIQDIYLRVLVDNPLFYYINQTVIRMNYIPGYYILMPEYLYTPREITLLDQDIRNMVNKVCTNARRVAKSDFRLEKYLHDSVVKSVAYDYESVKKSGCYNAHSVVGAFMDRKAVCEGIAKAFKLLCNECMIKCIVVLGQADPDGIYDVNSYHACNIVKIGDDSYHVDPTWDNMYDKGFEHISYDYFNLTTADIMKDHKPMGILPDCTSARLNYFACTNSFVSSFEELERFVAERISKRAIMFKYVRDKGEFLTDEEIKIKVGAAVCRAMTGTDLKRDFAIVINEVHHTVKVLFV